MKIDIDKLSEEELLDLNHRVVERLKFLESYHTHKEMMGFSPGDKVSFEPPGRARMVGILVKFNKKTVTVMTESGQKWNVSPHLLSQVKTVEQKTQGNNIFELHGKEK
ncbi:MAG: hypothetical protein ACI8P9_005342 [Parasphingorhabdus sp.]|jgi:hypothetical protein